MLFYAGIETSPSSISQVKRYFQFEKQNVDYRPILVVNLVYHVTN